MTRYSTQSHYPDMEQTSLCPILLMQNTKLEGTTINLVNQWFDSTRNRTRDLQNVHYICKLHNKQLLIDMEGGMHIT